MVVWCDAAGLALRGPASSRAQPVRPAPPAWRPGRDLLLRALGGWRQVIDATGGFAADAGTLAAAGCQVTLIERHPVVALILRDALQRWQQQGLPAAAAMTLLEGDALALLPTLRTEVVVLDPMYPRPPSPHPPRKGEVLHLLRQLLGDDSDQGALLLAARHCASARVVVKRPRAAPYLNAQRASGSLSGRSVRYDLYPPEEDHCELKR